MISSTKQNEAMPNFHLDNSDPSIGPETLAENLRAAFLQVSLHGPCCRGAPSACGPGPGVAVTPAPSPAQPHAALVLLHEEEQSEREGGTSSAKWSFVCDVQLTDGVQFSIRIFQVSYQTRLNSILKFPF